jgi:predicted nuclease of predicted toxin-antitoxin system
VKFKLDENLPVELVTDLRGLGHDADTVADEGLCGAADPAVVDAAFASDRILITSTRASLISSGTLLINKRE